MNICLDARTATPHFPGIGRYVMNLVQALGESVRPGDHLFILVPARGGAWWFALPGDRVSVVETDFGPFSLSQQWALPALLHRLKIDLYHSTYLAMPYRPGCPTVLTVYDLIPLILPRESSLKSRWLFRLSLKAALNVARRVISISHNTARDLAGRTGLDPRSTTVTSLAAAPHFRPASPRDIKAVRTRLNLPDRYALFLGAARPHKNLARLVRAWPESSPTVLVAAGPGQPRSRSGRVWSLGPVPDQDLPALMTGADFLVCPSLYEGFGLTILEAMACGVPVAASQTSGLLEVGGPAARYFNPWDEKDIRRALVELLESPALREELGARGLTRASAFTWAKTAAGTWAVYRELAGGAGS
jgi:alpha-1,3-rhamnosyl/mannosyltransferase